MESYIFFVTLEYSNPFRSTGEIASTHSRFVLRRETDFGGPRSKWLLAVKIQQLSRGQRAIN